ncbi:outer membrane receptor for ferric coprogen and ferric-rhodotorulic acid [Pseudomonas nitritireducens]|uniref:Outer membrane receptor for ferric coprogen and ferric-rhodotorulic acid n=1 Tax=Pseudomonas nitroreducens TaxID=46680 RepID=A0A7W7KQ92_PSENT|nr:TonB-dependent siderophore receptor [Pseudomonas nitritireducens]MBB4866283.1 outer membrane receptor for ferric coprogen and ferric-rhodotorulic acid [Pseudomonas nitritireducens]
MSGTHPQFRRTRFHALPLALPLAMGGALLATPLAALVAPAAWAQDVQAEYAFDIPAGSLEDAIAAFSDVAGVSVSYEPGATDGRQSPGLRGRFAASTALMLLLDGSGLQAVERQAGSFTLRAANADADSALQMSETIVMGQGMGEMTENSHSYTTGLVSVGSKTPVSLKDTPQSVSVITRQMIDDRQLTTLPDAMRRTPGITVRNGSYNAQQLYSRGFPIDNLQIDGAAPMDIGSGIGTFYSNRQYDMSGYDHVEVLRGASGLLGGTGDPGGIVNLVRKRPLDHYQLKLETSAGSWDNYRSEVDLTGPLAFDGRLRGRMVAAYTDRQYFMDTRSTERPYLFGTLEADVTDSTLLTLGGSYDKVKENGTGDGLPRYSTGGDVHLPRHSWYTSNSAWADSYTREWFAKVDHYFNDDWKLNTSYTYSYNGSTTEGVIPYGSVDETSNTGPYWWGSYIESWSKQSVVDVNLSGHFDAFGRQHELLLGADYQKVTSRWSSAQGMVDKGGLIDLWDPSSTPLPSNESNHNLFRDYSPNTREQYGVYSTLRLQLSDPLKLVLGARAQRYKFEQAYSMRNSDGSGPWVLQDKVSDREPTTLVPYGGLIYALDDNWSTYVSYSEVFKPQAQKFKGPEDAPSSIEPMTGKTYETGIKGELFEGKLNVSAALFYTQREHQAATDPSYPNPPFSYSGSCCFVAQDKITSKGIDLEASGEIAPGWEILAGYTYNQLHNDTEETLYSTVTPKHLFKLWTTYALPGDFAAWRVGAGVTTQSPTYVSGTAYRFDANGNTIDSRAYDFSQSGYAVYDALVEYQVDQHWSVALNGNNLFDRRYYASVGTSEYGNYYGEPRNFTLTLRGNF